VIATGYPYELVGIFYYVLFMLMSRKRLAGKYTARSRILVILAGIVMIACVPFHYAATGLGVAAMYALAIVALLSTFIDAAVSRRRG